jgi:hypothetical protein
VFVNKSFLNQNRINGLIKKLPTDKLVMPRNYSAAVTKTPFKNLSKFLFFNINVKSIAYWILMTRLILSAIKAPLQRGV